MVGYAGEGPSVAGSAESVPVGFLSVRVPGPGGAWIEIDGEHFYDDKYWEPDLYWAWQDSIWQDPPTGTVSVEPLEVVREDD